MTVSPSTSIRPVSLQFAGGSLKSLVVGATTLSTAITGQAFDLRAGYATFSVQASGVIAGSKILLEGSLDGTNWVTLGSTVGYTSTAKVVLTSTNDKPLQFVRLKALTLTTGASRSVVGYIGVA